MLVSSSSLRERALDVAVAVAPGAELLDDPGREPRRRVVEPVGQRLRLRALDALVAGLPRSGTAAACARGRLLLRRARRASGFAPVGGERDHHVQVDAGAVRRVEARRSTCVTIAPQSPPCAP